MKNLVPLFLRISFALLSAHRSLHLEVYGGMGNVRVEKAWVHELEASWQH